MTKKEKAKLTRCKGKCEECIYFDYSDRRGYGHCIKHDFYPEPDEIHECCVTEIEVLKQIRAEIKEGLYGPEEMSETDSGRAEAFNNGLNYCIEIIDKALKEVEQ